MKKYIVYPIILAVGICIGWLIFAETKNDFSTHSIIEESNNPTIWTCSMHPQIKQTASGDCPICGMDLIPVKTDSKGLAPNEIKMTKNAIALANIQTSIVGNTSTKNEDSLIAISGKIIANEENNAVQASYFDGRIERLYVTYEGQKINKGQLLATIYSPNLVAAQQELITAVSLKESQSNLYQAVRNKLKLWKLSEKQINNIESSGKVRENFPIYATVSGTVAMVMAAEGDYIKQGQPILKVNNLNSVWASFDVYENQISKFKKGQRIKVTTNAYPDKEFDAVISFIDPVLNTKTRTLAIRVTLKNTNNLLKPGMFILGRIKGNSLKASAKVITVPASAVLWTGKRSLVYIKTNPNEAVFAMREVTLGNKLGENYQITSGLKNGDEIVTNGTFTVDAAAQLQGKKSMMNKKGKELTATISMEMKLPINFQEEFTGVLKAYFKLKNAFVASELAAVITSAEAGYKILNQIPLTNLAKIEKAHVTKSLGLLEAITNSKDLVKQRAYFVILNESIMALAMSLENPEQKIYIQKCPMANSNKGAVWLSTKKEIQNPYYGDTMLACGSIIKTIK